MKKIFTSIDIGSDTVKFLVGEEFKDRVNVLSATEITSKGVRKGLIVDSNLLVNTIKDGLKVIDNELGINIKKTLVNVPDYNAKFMFVTGSIQIKDIVNSDDVNRVVKESVYNKLDKEYELVTVVPLCFVIDEEREVDVPIGLACKKLEVKGIMISVPKKNIYSVISVIEAAGLEVVDITLSGLSDYYQVRNKKLDSKIGAIVNIGHETTNVSIINNGKMMNTETLQLGGINIENDIAYVFGINLIDARKIKEKFASCHKRFTSLNDTYELTNNMGEKIKLNQLEVTEVVMSRVSEILNYAKKQINLLTKKQVDYIIITGGLTEIKSFKNLVYEILGKDVIIYLMEDIGIRDNKYTTCMGMIKYFIDKMHVRGKEYSMLSSNDEELLLTPADTRKKEKVVVTKMFKSFIKNKEEK